MRSKPRMVEGGRANENTRPRRVLVHPLDLNAPHLRRRCAPVIIPKGRFRIAAAKNSVVGKRESLWFTLRDFDAPFSANFQRNLIRAGRSASILGVAGLAIVGGAAASRGMEPIVRTGTTPLRSSLSAYSLRQALERAPGSDGAIDLLQFAELAARWGFDAVEPTSYYFPTSQRESFVCDLKRKCARLGLDVSGGAIRNNFTLPPGAELDREFARSSIGDLYAELGAAVIRVFAGSPPTGLSLNRAIDNAVRNLEQACAAAGERGVAFTRWRITISSRLRIEC